MANLKGSGSNDIGLNYKSILNIGTANDGLSNISSTLQTVTDGDGNTTPFQLSTTKIGIYGGSNRVVEFNAITGDWIGYGSSQMSPYNFNTGNFEIQADSNFNIDFRIGTNTKMFLTNSGNLGIGTTTTSARLQVKGDGTNNILDLKSGDGVSKFYVNNQGIASAAAFTAAAYIRIGSNFFQESLSDGVLTYYNNAGSGFNRLQFGGTTNAFPALKRTGAGLECRLADDSNYTNISLATLVSLSGVQSYGVIEAYNATTAISVSGPIKWGTTNAFPSIKRNGTDIEVRLADDSAFTNVRAASFDEGTGYTSRFYQNIIQLYDGNTVRGHSGGSGFSFNTSGVFGTTNVPVASAILEAVSTTKGFLPPRMTTAQRTAISSPAAGLIVFDTDTTKSYTYDGSTWQAHW